jgi:hypothetical protein
VRNKEPFVFRNPVGRGKEKGGIIINYAPRFQPKTFKFKLLFFLLGPDQQQRRDAAV